MSYLIPAAQFIICLTFWITLFLLLFMGYKHTSFSTYVLSTYAQYLTDYIYCMLWLYTLMCEKGKVVKAKMVFGISSIGNLSIKKLWSWIFIAFFIKNSSDIWEND